MTKTSKSKRAVFIIVAIVMAALLLIPVVGLATGRDTGVQATLPLADSLADTTRPKGTHMLEWGVFGIALGEFAGILGMGMSKARTKRKVKKAEDGVLTQPLPMAMKPEDKKTIHFPAA